MAKSMPVDLQFRSQARQVLAVLADFVGFAGCALSDSLFIIKPSAILLLKALDILVLRHGGWRVMLQQENMHTFNFAAWRGGRCKSWHGLKLASFVGLSLNPKYMRAVASKPPSTSTISTYNGFSSPSRISYS